VLFAKTESGSGHTIVYQTDITNPVEPSELVAAIVNLARRRQEVRQSAGRYFHADHSPQLGS